MRDWQKGDRTYRAIVVDFEGEPVALVLPGIVATVNPQRDGSKTYHVRNYNPHNGSSWTTHSHLGAELFDDPVTAMQVALGTAEAEKARAAKPEAANG